MATAQPRSKGPYSVHPGVLMVEKWISDLKGKTGRSVEEWVALVRKSGPRDDAGRRAWLKSKHGLGTNSAWWLVERAAGKGAEDTPAGYLKAAPRFVEEQYAGPKKNLRPVYNALLGMGKKLGRDVKACPCKTIVPLYREHVFAQLKPTTNTRVDLGLALAKYKGKLPARLIDTGGLAKKDRITHRIAISGVKQIDPEVKKWLKVAYDLDA